MNPLLIWQLIRSLPDLIKLLQVIQAAIDKAETDRKVKDDIKTIHEAFSSNDPTKLNALFANTKQLPK